MGPLFLENFAPTDGNDFLVFDKTKRQLLFGQIIDFLKAQNFKFQIKNL